jgi:hypothetical protein
MNALPFTGLPNNQNAANTPAGSLPVDIAIIAQFSYLSDCHVKIPVSIRQKDSQFFMKNPVKPNPEWKMNLIIRSIDFPDGQIIKLMKTPFGELDNWECQVLRKVAHSEYAEIYEISEPKHFQLNSNRRSNRIFCLTPIRCFIGDSNQKVNATCIDISDDGVGLGIRFDQPTQFQIGDKCRIHFNAPFENLPELVGKIVRQSTSALDKSVSVGLVALPEYTMKAQKAIEFIAQRQAQEGSDSYVQSFEPQRPTSTNRRLLNNLSDSIPKDFFSLFQNKG